MRSRRKRGQIKMFESIAVLIIFFFLLSFGFTFYGKMQSISNDKKMHKAIEIDAVSLAIRTSNLAEIQCSMKNVAEPNCYDELKLKAFADMIQDPSSDYLIDHYYNVLGYSRIKLHILYPLSEKETIDIYDRPRGDGAGVVTLMPVSIYHPLSTVYKFAVLNVTYYPPE